MPIYEYQCSACGHRLEVIQKFSDAPLTDFGKETLNDRYLLPGETIPEPPAAHPVTAIARFELTESAAIFDNLPVPVVDKTPRNMEAYDQGRGCILYRTTISAGPAAELSVQEARDFAWVFLDGKPIGTMDRLIISPAMWRKYYKPAWKKGIDLAHRYGAKIWFHSCGCIMPLLEDLIEIGIDCWNPFPEYVWGNDHKQLKQLRKGRLALDGGVSHLVLVQGTEREVVEETRRVLDLFAPDGGLLIGPSQVFTQDMPAANIIAFLETALAYQG